MALIQTIDNQEAYADKALVLGYREARQYALNIEDYSILRIGLVLSLVDSGTLRPAGTSALRPSSTASVEKDKIWIGMRSGATGFPDGDDVFMGAIANPKLLQSNPPTRAVYTTANGELSYGTYMNGGGGELSARTDFRDQLYFFGYYDPDQDHSDVGLAMYNVIEFHIGNKGAPDQNVVIKATGSSNNPYPVNGEGIYDSETLTTDLKDHSWRNTTSIRTMPAAALNKDGAALDLPKNLFIYWPFSSCRLCIHGVAVEAV